LENREELLKKIKILAERGADGERESAQQMLERLMKKYDISEEDLEVEILNTEWFRYHDEIELRVLNQIIYMITGKGSYGCVGTYTGRSRKQRGIDCTKAERLEIEANYEFFKRAIREEFDIFFTAFCSKNYLYPKEDKVPGKNLEALTKEERKKLFKAGLMAEGMERHTLKKMLE